MQIITNNAGKELKKHGDNAFPFLVSYERLSGYETGSFLWHWHPEIELTYVKKGEMLYKVNQNTFHLKEGQALFGNANALHAGYMYQNQDCQYIPVTFDPKLIYGFSGSALFQKYTEPILRSFSLSAVPLDFSCDWIQHYVSVKFVYRDFCRMSCRGIGRSGKYYSYLFTQDKIKKRISLYGKSGSAWEMYRLSDSILSF